VRLSEKLRTQQRDEHGAGQQHRWHHLQAPEGDCQGRDDGSPEPDTVPGARPAHGGSRRRPPLLQGGCQRRRGVGEEEHTVPAQGGPGRCGQARRVLQLVESCAGSILSSGAMAARFDYVEKRITTCLNDLGAANGVSMESKIDQLAARDRHLHGNKPFSKKQKQVNAGKAPPMGGSKNDGQGKGGQNRGKGGKRRREKKVAAVARSPPLLSDAGVPTYPNGNGYAYSVHHHSIEEDPTSCSVM
ncbi:unnamed protein product, partial [Urochloa humidicola]